MARTPNPSRLAGGVLSYFTRHGTAANLLLILMLAAGILASTKIRSQFFPDVVLENITIRASWNGAGPEDIDNSVISVIEPAIIAVEGINNVTSTAKEGSFTIRLEFEPNWDMARALEEVKSAVDAVTNLPENLNTIKVKRGVWRDRVTDVVISGPVSPQQLSQYADEFVARLYTDGITRTRIRGVAAPVIDVRATEATLIRHDITLSEISNAISKAAEADPAGDVAGGTARVRTGVEKRSAEDIGEIVVRSNPDGSKLRVSDVAEIVVEESNRVVAYFKGENPAVSIRVDRSDKGDAISMQAQVQRAAEEMVEFLPQGVEIELIRTRAEAITDRLNILLDNGALGLAMVVGLLFLFLSARTAFWVAAGIPAAMFAAIAFMYVAGLTINMISLFGLIIVLGIVVDDAIVVGEHADFRARRLGEDPTTAAENAARRMASPVFSATITTVIAFYALTFVDGWFGRLIEDIPLTVIAVLLASLIECFLILPNHMRHALVSQATNAWYDWPSRTFNHGFRYVRDVAFRPLMAWVVRLRYPVIAGAFLILTQFLAMFYNGDVTWRFINFPERGSISGNIMMLPGATREDTRTMVRELDRAAKTVAAKLEEEHGENPVTFVMTQVGGTTGRGLSGSDTKDPDQLGSIAIELTDADQRPYSSHVFVGALQEEVRKHPLLETLSFRGWRSGGGGDALDVKFYGENSPILKQASEALRSAVEQYEEVSAVEDDLAYDKAELVLELTPQGEALGFTIDDIGRELYRRLNGITASEFPVGNRTGKIIVRLPEEELTASFLDLTRMRLPGGDYVPLSELVTISSTLGFSTVKRVNGLRVVTVNGDISEDDPERASEIITELRSDILPRIESELGVRWELGGLAESEEEFLSDALYGFYLCLLGIYLTLTWIFASWGRPLAIILVIPFGLVGTIYGHMAWDVPLSMFTVVGLIGMSGIIINDSIVLVTTIDEYSKDRGLVPAVIDATADRLRPVLLTTLTTVLGLAPLLFETSRQAQFLKPTVITLCYGLGFGVFLVLLVVPAFIIIGKDISNLFKAFWRGAFGHHPAKAHRGVLLVAGAANLGIVALTIGVWAATGEVSSIVQGLSNWLEVTQAMAMSLTLIGGIAVVTIAGLIAALLLLRSPDAAANIDSATATNKS